MAAVLTGTPVAVTWAAGANPAGQSITIPSDATAVYMFWSFYTSADGNGLASVTLAGNAPAQTFETPTAAVDQTGTGVAAWYNPATGSQTLDPAWDAAPEEGSTCVVVFVKDGDTAAWRDADADNQDSTTACSVTLTTVSGDLVLKFDQRFSGTTPPSLSSGWTNGQTQNNNSESARLSYISATGTTQVCASEDDNYSSVCAISIPAAATGAISGSSAMVFGAGSSTLTGAGALAGPAALIFGAGTSTLTGAGALAGSSALTFTPAGALAGAGSLAGAAAMLFGGTGALAGTGALVGSGALVFTPSGTLNVPAGDISGTADMLLSASGALAGAGALAGTAALAFSAQATADQPAPAPRARRGVARSYIIKGKRYLLTNEQLVYMLARDLIDATREDIRIKYKAKKPHVISKNHWAELQETMKSLENAIPEVYDESDDEEAFVALM